MTSDEGLWFKVLRMLNREAMYLDDRDWDAWLALYDRDAEYWAPAWDDDGQTTVDPLREISLIYYDNRGGLEDRVYRIRTERSSATMPAMRTCHNFTLLDVSVKDGVVHARSNWIVNSFKEDETLTYYGHAFYEFKGQDDDMRIMRKKTVVLNDRAKTMMDVYTI